MKLLNELSEHLSGLNVEWHLCGGFAIDAYLGNITRKHKDVDITVSFDNMKECIRYLKSKGWEIDAPVGNQRLVPVEFALQNSELYFDNIWCYKKGANFIKTEKTDGVFKYVKFIDREQTELDFIEVLFNKIEKCIIQSKSKIFITIMGCGSGIGLIHPHTKESTITFICTFFKNILEKVKKYLMPAVEQEGLA